MIALRHTIKEDSKEYSLESSTMYMAGYLIQAESRSLKTFEIDTALETNSFVDGGLI